MKAKYVEQMAEYKAQYEMLDSLIYNMKSAQAKLQSEWLDAEIKMFKEMWTDNENNKENENYEELKQGLTEYGNILQEQINQIKKDKQESKDFVKQILGE